MQPKKRALGKGLGALLPPAPVTLQPIKEPATPVAVDESMLRLPLDQLVPNPKQPRAQFSEEALERLAESIIAHGVIQPVAVVRKDSKYLIVAGERRWRAAKQAGIEKIPAIVLELSDREIFEYALVENLQREDLNPLEEARAYQALIGTFGLSQEDVADRVGKSRSAVANALRLLRLPDSMQKDVEDGLLSAGHARAILAIEDPEKQRRLRDLIIAKQLSVREAERVAMPTPTAKPRAPRSNAAEDANVTKLREQLIEALECRVTIKTVDDQRGKIEIYYNSLDELERVLATLGVQL